MFVGNLIQLNCFKKCLACDYTSYKNLFNQFVALFYHIHKQIHTHEDRLLSVDCKGILESFIFRKGFVRGLLDGNCNFLCLFELNTTD